jgi:hypothetical protein
MNSNLVDTTHSETVQLPMRLESGKYPLNARAAVIDKLPLGIFGIRLNGSLVRRVSLNDWSAPKLLMNQMPERFTRIASVSNDIPRTKLAVDPTRLAQKYRGSIDISAVATHHVDCQRNLVGCIYQQRDLVSPSELLATVGILLGYPPGIVVRRSLVRPVRPRLDISGIYGYRLSKVRQCAIELSSLSVEYLINLPFHTPLRQLREESRESRLTRNSIWRFNTASSGDVGVVMEKPDQIRNRRKPLQIIDDVATPKYLGIIPMRPTSRWPSECFNKFFVNIRKLSQHCLDLLNHRRQWSLLTKCSNISVGHLEANPSFWLGVAGVLSTGDSSFTFSSYFYSILPYQYGTCQYP